MEDCSDHKRQGRYTLHSNMSSRNTNHVQDELDIRTGRDASYSKMVSMRKERE